MTDRELPRSAKALMAKLDGWSTRIDWGTGQRTTRIKGLVHNRPGLVDAIVPVQSVSIKAGHVDTRWFVACWVKVGDDGKWAFDLAYRKFTDNDWPRGLPVELNSREVTAYATAPNLADALADIESVQAEAADRAALRARKKAAEQGQAEREAA